jgi:D-alanyl-D-alanine dipeptidase
MNPSRLDTASTVWSLRQQAIPDQGDARARKRDYRRHRVDTGAPEAAEPLVDLTALGLRGRNLYAAADAAPYYQTIPGAIDALWLREGVARKLVAVDARLASAGLALFVHDAWRPRAVQAHFHDVWTPAWLRRRFPELSDAEIRAETSTYWAAPTEDPSAPAPHETGAAVDVSLVRAGDGQPLWMGSLVDEVSSLAWRDHFEGRADTDLGISDTEARANRRLLHWVMAEAGFAGLPDEWWHFSHGDQMWARLSGAAAAHYGIASAPAA